MADETCSCGAENNERHAHKGPGAVLEVLDPALCCPTGVCGPSPDPKLVSFADDLGWLRSQGAAVSRFNLADHPEVFVNRDEVRTPLAERGTESLPLVLYEGRIVSQGNYPTRRELAALVGLSVPENADTAGSDGAQAPARPCECEDDLSSHRDAIYRYVLSMMRDPAEAEDLTQDTMLRAHNSLPTLRDRSKLLPWLYRIATNICYDRLRRTSSRGRPQSLDGDDAFSPDRQEALVDASPRLDKAMEQEEMSACVQRYMTELPEPYLAAILLHDVKGLTNPEIAEMLGISLPTVKIRLHRARKKLRATLGDACTFTVDERGVRVCEPKSKDVLE